MSTVGYTADIHKVADTDKRMALFLGMAFLFVWVVALNIAIQDMTPRWFQREYDWLSASEIPSIFLSMAFASLIAAAGLWLFSGNGNRLYHIDGAGITVDGLFGSTPLTWTDFASLDRQVSTINLYLTDAAKAKCALTKVVFDVSKIDCTGSQLEALIVYYRPDLYRTLANGPSAPVPAATASTPAKARTIAMSSRSN